MTLSPKTLKLWKEVTKGYGKPIREGKPSDLTEPGFSKVSADGAPIIELADDARDEDHLVHELMHLKLKLEGFSAEIEWNYDCANDPNSWPMLEWVRQNLEDSIEHWIFYPRVRAMGRTPDQGFTTDMGNVITRDHLAPAPVYQRAVEYFRVLTLPNQPDLARRMTAMYKEHEWSEAMETGNQMFNILMARRPANPEQSIETLVACANVLFKGTKTFNTAGWKTSVRGNVRLRTAEIDVTSLGSCRP